MKTSKKRSSAANQSKPNPPAAPAIAEYTRTPAELDLVARQRQRRERQSPAPEITMQHKPPHPANIEADHPDKSLWFAK